KVLADRFIYEVVNGGFGVTGHQWNDRIELTPRDFQRMCRRPSFPVLSSPTINRDKMHWVTGRSHCPSHSTRTRPLLPCPDALRELWRCLRERSTVGFHGESPDLLHPVTTRPRPGFPGVAVPRRAAPKRDLPSAAVDPRLSLASLILL